MGTELSFLYHYGAEISAYALMIGIAFFYFLRKIRGAHSVWGAVSTLAYVFSTVGGVWLVNRALERNTQEKLMGYAPSYAKVFEGSDLDRINANQNPEDETYLKLIDLQKHWLKVNPYVADIYTMTKNQAGQWYFVIDSETDYDGNGIYEGERESRTTIGEVYQKDLPELEQAWRGEASFTKQVYNDRWGSWVSAFVPLKDKQGQILGVLGVDFPAEVYIFEKNIFVWLSLVLGFLLYLAITHELISRWNIRLAFEAAKKLAEDKASFTASISHEFRTPLVGILGSLQLMERHNLSQAQLEHLLTVQTCAESLLALVNDILDFTKFEAKKLKILHEPFYFDQMLKEVILVTKPMATQKGVKLDLKSKVDGLAVLGDLLRCRQIFINLVNNAVKFTEEGSVLVTVEVISQDEKQIALQINVKDTGIGISQASLGKIFSPYVRGDNQRIKHYGGTGLGLVICKNLVEAMGGTISVSSEVGRGSEFDVRLPFVKSEIESLPEFETWIRLKEETLQDLERKPEILVVDDVLVNRTVLQGFIKKLGFSCDVVDGGKNAMRAVQEKHYDLVLMDCQMPDIDGYEATRQVLNNHKGSPPVVVAVTANTGAEELAKCREAGMKDLLSKPYTLKQLEDMIMKHWSTKGSVSEQAIRERKAA